MIVPAVGGLASKLSEGLSNSASPQTVGGLTQGGQGAQASGSGLGLEGGSGLEGTRGVEGVSGVKEPEVSAARRAAGLAASAASSPKRSPRWKAPSERRQRRPVACDRYRQGSRERGRDRRGRADGDGDGLAAAHQGRRSGPEHLPDAGLIGGARTTSFAAHDSPIAGLGHASLPARLAAHHSRMADRRRRRGRRDPVRLPVPAHGLRAELHDARQRRRSLPDRQDDEHAQRAWRQLRAAEQRHRAGRPVQPDRRGSRGPGRREPARQHPAGLLAV